MISEKYKSLVEQRISTTYTQWAEKISIEERDIYRFLHNLKGTAGTIGMTEIEKLAENKLMLFSDNGKRPFTYLEWYIPLEELFLSVPTHGTHQILAELASTSTTGLSELAGNRILIVDDDVDLAAYLKGVLEDKGYPVHIALTAERGLKLFYDWKPNLILLDILLPDTNGLEMLKQIVEKSQLEHIPVIVISSEDTKEHRIHAYEYGAMDFFAKPIDQELLIALINNRFQMKQQWENSIIIDELTRAYNRKHFNRVMKQLIMDFHRTSRIFTLALIDLDHFKKVNDTYGHLMGDEVLRSFAATIMAAKREEDILCRYGGEEFALILPNTGMVHALDLIQRIRDLFSAHYFSYSDIPFQVTFTAGLTEIHKGNIHMEQLVEEADQALYLGKQSGRNKSVLYTPELLGSPLEQKLNILIVDDDPVIRELIATHFSSWQSGRKLEVSIQGYEDGIQFLQSQWYNEGEKYIIFLDGAMPVMDGVEVLHQLRQDYLNGNIVVAMLTARNNQNDIIHALQHGADDYIIKPFQLTELVSRVERLVQKLYK